MSPSPKRIIINEDAEDNERVVKVAPADKEPLDLTGIEAHPEEEAVKATPEVKSTVTTVAKKTDAIALKGKLRPLSARKEFLMKRVATLATADYEPQEGDPKVAAVMNEINRITAEEKEITKQLDVIHVEEENQELVDRIAKTERRLKRIKSIRDQLKKVDENLLDLNEIIDQTEKTLEKARKKQATKEREAKGLPNRIASETDQRKLKKVLKKINETTNRFGQSAKDKLISRKPANFNGLNSLFRVSTREFPGTLRVANTELFQLNKAICSEDITNMRNHQEVGNFLKSSHSDLNNIAESIKRVKGNKTFPLK